jgi:branched-chain amino acid aminotransferase
MTEPPGVYTVFRTYEGDRAVELEAHFQRLEESAVLEGIQLHLDRPRLRTGLRELIRSANFAESRIRVTIVRQTPDEPILAIEPLQSVPAELLEHGVKARTVPWFRRNPRSKSNAWETARARSLLQLPDDVYEGILVNEDGELLEGFTSNFHAIEGDEIYSAADGVLQGISRRILIEVIPDNLHLIERAITRSDLPELDEAFLTSSSRGIVPIIQVDDVSIGTGSPGPWTARLAERYRRWVEEHLETI